MNDSTTNSKAKARPKAKASTAKKAKPKAKSKAASDSTKTTSQVAVGATLRLPKLSHLAAEKLRDQIISGQLEPGSVLSPESQLTKLFDISRPTLREALRILESQGLIKVGRGNRSGAIVLGPSVDKAAEYTSYILVNKGVTLLELHEARMFIEPEILRNLEGSAQTKAAEQLRACTEEIQIAVDEHRYKDAITGSARFHETLAGTADNFPIVLLTKMLQTITDSCYTSILGAEEYRDEKAIRDNLNRTIIAYQALCQHLEDDTAEVAADYWHDYMVKARGVLQRSKFGERKLVHRSIADSTGR